MSQETTSNSVWGKVSQSVRAAVGSEDASGGFQLSLQITDPEVINELARLPNDRERERFVLSALRVGVLTLKVAKGELDAGTVREAGNGIISNVRELLTERSHSLIGELKQQLQEHVQGDASTLARTLSQRLGEDSPLFKMLSPTNTEGLKAQLEKLLGQELQKQREVILREFSLNEETSALSRFRKTIDDLRQEVRTNFDSLKVRKEVAVQSNLYGKDFEVLLTDWLSMRAQHSGDIADAVGAELGQDRNRKGDAVIELGADSGAPGVRIVWEAKAADNWSLKKALDELKQAKENRNARHGVFVFSKRQAPKDMTLPILRVDEDVLVCWDPDDASGDIALLAAYGLVRALAIRAVRVQGSAQKLYPEIDATLRMLQRQLEHLAAIMSAQNNILRHCNSIDKEVQLSRDDISERLARLYDLSIPAESYLEIDQVPAYASDSAKTTIDESS